ncbi:MAG: hypothetical protein EXQ98_07955, partial [Alphaproteobacteria bacterium]|nr:hypothetical protein [Alphaproteobacteria bacterium]
RLDSLKGLRAGSENGPVAKPGDPAGSELIKRLKGESEPRMPLSGPPFLDDKDIALIERWIASGMAGAEPSTATATPAEPPAAAKPKPGEFVTCAHVAPIFARQCVKCHNQKGLMGPPPEGYQLDSYAHVLSRDDRVRVVPGSPDASELVRRIRGQARPRMPFDGPPFLTEDEIQLIERWIAEGARDSTGKKAPIPVGAHVRLEGTLTAHWQLDGYPLVVQRNARVRDASPGSYVRVRGRIDDQGQVIVNRIDGKD